MFKPISFHLLQGEVLLLQGENGSGKTTLLRALAGFLSHQGAIVRTTPIAYLNDKDHLFSHFTAHDELIFWKNLHAVPTNQYQNLLDLFHVTQFLQKKIYQLSAGQKKKISLIRFFLRQAKIWLLDEPFTYLDVASKKILLSKINEHLKEGAVVMSAHDELPDLRKKILLLPEGAIQ